MRRLGYDRYGAQGDFGAFISTALGKAAPDNVVGVHLNAATYGFHPLGRRLRGRMDRRQGQGVDLPERNLPEAAIDRDRMLTDVTIYWLTGTG